MITIPVISLKKRENAIAWLTSTHTMRSLLNLMAIGWVFAIEHSH
ncbi:hypothetical protein [Allocoleopsis sp.]